ncbi:MAG: anaerobic sulfite reductase subunit AsrA [Clostridium sp.]
MGYKLNIEEFNNFLEELGKEYKIYAPKRFEKEGRYSDTDLIKYAEVKEFNDIVYKEKSDFPAKEVISPVNQTLYYFTEDEFRESKPAHNKKILIFLRPCDINAQERQDKIYLENGGFEDKFYKRMRDRVKFVCMECVDGFDTCFCTAMNTNKTESYSLGVRFNEDSISFELKDEEFKDYFKDKKEEEFKIDFIKENTAKVNIPEIKDEVTLEMIHKHPMWEEYNKRCISCGSCTVACSTCTCFTTRDIAYSENGKVGERRRVEASCQIAGFDTMAGGHSFRNTAGDRMRYKVLHKVHDYKQKFGVNMCVGCGRCTDRCPENISMTATINKLSKAIEEISGGKK